MKLSTVVTGKIILPVIGASFLLFPSIPAEAAAQRLEKHFSVKAGGSYHSQYWEWTY